MRCVSLFVAFKDPDMVWLRAVWSTSTSSSWQLWTPSTVSSHAAYHRLHFTCCGSSKDKFTAQPRELHKPTLLRGLFYTQEICICMSSTGSFALLHKDSSVFFKAFLSGQLVFCFVFCEVCSCVRDDIIQTRRHGRAEFDGCGGSSCFYNCSIVIPCFVLIFIVPTSQSLGSCHRSAPVYTVSCPERVQSWSRLVPVRAAAHTSVQICGIFPSNKQLSPTNEHML